MRIAEPNGQWVSGASHWLYAQSTQSKPGRQSCRSQLALFVVALFVFFGVSFLILGPRPLSDYDEAIYAQVAREALSSHSQFSFTWKGNVGLHRPLGWYEKPPLMIWLTEFNFWLIGRSELSARLSVLLFAIATVVLTCLWVRSSTGSVRAGILAGSAYLIAFQYLSNSFVLQLDIPVGFFVLLSLVSFVKAQRDERYYYVFWLSIGLGVLTKSVIGILPIPIVLIASAIGRRWAFNRSRAFYLGFLLFLAVALPWHLVETIRFGSTFWSQYVGYHLFTRWSVGLEGNGQPFWFYWHLLAHNRLLFIFFVPSIVYMTRRCINGDFEGLVVVIAYCSIFLFFSSSHTKLPAYILVIYPYLAVSIGVFLSASLDALAPRINALVTILVIGVWMFLGTTYMTYFRHEKQADRYLADSRSVGTYLANDRTGLDIYTYSTTGTQPEVIYYSNRVVYYLPVGNPRPAPMFLLISGVTPPFHSASIASRTPTQAVYIVK